MRKLILIPIILGLVLVGIVLDKSSDTPTILDKAHKIVPSPYTTDNSGN
ncbi:TPA: hypothetical protein ACMDQP_003117 [Vibrio cholerae]